METNLFGATGRRVTRVGLGGEGVLRTHGRAEQAAAIIREAYAQGIRYFDSARVYADSEIYYGAYWADSAHERRSLFLTSKSASRDKRGVLADLSQSLHRLHASYLDLYQIHDVRSATDLTSIGEPGGALEGFVEAKERGLVRHIGVTGHHDPEILARAVESWPVDAVLLPVNPVESLLGGFLTRTLSAARDRGLAVIGMKVLGGGHFLHPAIGIGADQLLRYALGCDVDCIIVGCSTIQEVRALATAGSSAALLDKWDRQRIEATFAPYAEQLAFYRGDR